MGFLFQAILVHLLSRVIIMQGPAEQQLELRAMPRRRRNEGMEGGREHPSLYLCCRAEPLSPDLLRFLSPSASCMLSPGMLQRFVGWFGGDLDAYGGFVLFNACILNLREILHGDRSSFRVWCTLHTKDFNCEKNEDLLK